ncbi:MAG: hypothetical protein Q7S25_04655 [Candidatus Limnocylindria bacterium]|nr:hypothetical protein [Candidatus Limnocylindria bacterium]
MRVALVGGTELAAAAVALGLETVTERPELALIDLRDPAALAGAEALPLALPRVVVAAPEQRALARALGIPDAAIAPTAEPAALGPRIAAAAPVASPQPTRAVLVTAARGGTGRTLLVANLARRLAKRCATLVLDLTGSGSVGWWLGVTPRPWSDLEGLAHELSSEQLGVVAEDAARSLRVVGGAPHAPSVPVATAAVRAALGLVELVLIDAPVLADERTRAVVPLADRVLILGYDDAASDAALDAAERPDGAWTVASQPTRRTDGERAPFFVLPRDETAIAAALASRAATGGALGRAYDALAELIATDAER